MRRERGNGRLGVLIWIVVMAVAIFIAVRTIPVRIAVLNLHDFCDEQARYAAVSSKYTEKELLHSVLERANELGIPLEPKQIVYDKRKNVVRVSIRHSVTVDLEFYEWVWKYDRTFEHIRI